MKPDKRKPLVFGKMLNVPLAFVDGLLFAHDGRVDSVVFYEGGYELRAPIADYPDPPSLMRASVPVGAYVTCCAYGAIKFGDGCPIKLVTADVVTTSVGMYYAPEDRFD